MFTHYFLSIGLIYTGQYDQAISQIKEFKKFSHGTKGIGQKISCNQILFASYLEMQNLTKAEEILITLDQLIMNTNMSALKTIVSHLHNSLNMEKSIADGVYDGVIEHLSQKLTNCKKKLERVVTNFGIGVVYEKIGDIENSKEAFEYVVENGNTLYVVTEAKEHLAQITKNIQ
jgi:hypothetical protein